jgi:hypothetical protein
MVSRNRWQRRSQNKVDHIPQNDRDKCLEEINDHRSLRHRCASPRLLPDGRRPAPLLLPFLLLLPGDCTHA